GSVVVSELWKSCPGERTAFAVNARLSCTVVGRSCDYRIGLPSGPGETLSLCGSCGLSMVKERLRPHSQEIAQLGLSFVVSAGWLPGLTELLPVYAHERAIPSMDTIESVPVYIGDSREWSPAAFQDMAWFLRQGGS